MIRVGIGYDVHPLVINLPLVLGGVKIPYAKGLQGWSDADVLTHAVIDALLGAAALGDIGQHFPPGDPKYNQISSLQLLAEVNKELKQHGWQVSNIDVNVLADRPKLRDFILNIRQNIAQHLQIDVNRVSIKSRTSNGLGFVGRGEGIAAEAVVLIESEKSKSP